MALGDQADFTARLQKLIPNGWFANGLSPFRDAVLQGLASALSFAFSLLAYVQLQTRVATATDGFLDMIAGDFFGDALPRRASETDGAYRTRIVINLLRERGTRAAVVSILTQLTGRAPDVFEPTRPADTGAYGGPAIGYGVAGGYGSMVLPFQAFVTAYRPAAPGVPLVAGYGVSTGGYGQPSRADYATLLPGDVTDSDIYEAIDSVTPAGSVVWARITS